MLTPMMAGAKFETLDKKNPSVIVMHEQVTVDDYIQFMRATSDPSIKHYTILIHSPGGNAVTTIAIINRILELKRDGVTFTTKVHGVGLSAGSYIWLMGDERVVYEGSTLMWHTVMAQWKSWQREQVKTNQPDIYNLMERWDNYIRARFAEQSGMSKKSCEYWLDGGEAQFMSAETARNVGLATKYIAAK